MRILLIILGVIGGLTLLVVIGVVALFFIGMQQIGPIVDEGTTYANESIRAVATNWDDEELLNRAGPEMMEALTPQALDQFINFARNDIGPMTEYDDNAECFLADYELTTETGEVAFVNCVATAQFQKADGELKVSAVYRDETWKLVGFFINAEPRESITRTARFEAVPQLASLDVSLARRSIGLSTGDLSGLPVGAIASSGFTYLTIPAIPVTGIED